MLRLASTGAAFEYNDQYSVVTFVSSDQNI